MKYIRTKNGIYEVRTKMIFNHIKEYRLADTIEELCDEFVYEKGCGKDTPMLSKNDFNSLKEWYMNNGFKVNTIYGAIWTSKGLIYVAKMNEDGELELL